MKKGTIMILIAVLASLLLPICSMPDAEASKGPSSPTYYDQLDVNERAIYDSIVNAGTKENSITIDLPAPLANIDEYVESTLTRYLSDVETAVRFEQPMAHWFWGSAYKLSAHKVLFGSPDAVERITVSIERDKAYADDPSTPEDELQLKIDALNKVIDGFNVKSERTRDRVMEINSFITNLATYDPNAGTKDASPYGHDAYGALVSDNKYAVCDGYAKAFYLLATKSGIDIRNMIVLGGAGINLVNHAWNYVLVDEKWYAIDVTWNDSMSNAYFLQGSSTFFFDHYQGTLFGSLDGKEIDDQERVIPVPFEYPTLSFTKYDADPPGPLIDPIYLFALGIFGILLAVLIYGRKDKRIQ